MTTRLEKFKKEMEPAKEIYTKEIKDYAEKFDALGEMTLRERPDIDTLDYIYSFEKGITAYYNRHGYHKNSIHLLSFRRKNTAVGVSDYSDLAHLYPRSQIWQTNCFVVQTK